MNLLDLIILLPIALFAFIGFRNGIVREVFMIVGIVLAVFAAFRYMDALAGLLLPYTEQSADMMVMISGLILFTVTFLLVMIIAYWIRKFLEFFRLNFLNRILGLMFGGLKCGIIISAFLLFLTGMDMPAEETRNSSVVYPYVLPIAPIAYNIVASVYPGSEDFVERMRNSLDENNPLQFIHSLNEQP